VDSVTSLLGSGLFDGIVGFARSPAAGKYQRPRVNLDPRSPIALVLKEVL
jgi:hypothetical protein